MAVKNSHVDTAGQPSIDLKLCTFCKLCINVCPTFTLVEGDKRVVVDADTELGCIACLQCLAICPSDAVTISSRAVEANDKMQLPEVANKADAEQLSALMLARRSIRRFNEREVEPEVLDRVMAIASTAPMGIPPSDVHVIVFHGRDKVRELAVDALKCIRRGLPVLKKMVSPIGRLFLGRKTVEMFETFLIPEARSLIDEWEQGRDKLLYDAPAALYFHATPYVDEADVGIAATYAMLAAESLGLGSCMIGSLHPFFVRSKELCQKYGIPQDNKHGIALVLGYPRHKYKHAIRRRFGSVRER